VKPSTSQREHQEASSPPASSGVGPAERLFRAGREAHPGIWLEHPEFARGARERASWTAKDDGGSEEDALSAMERRGRGPDLYLALACDARIEGAWDRFCATTLPAVARALAAQGVPPAEADAAAAELPGHLIQPPRHGRSRTRLGGYRGASSLATFLAVAALALRTSARRGRSPASLDALREEGGGEVVLPSARPARAGLEEAEAASRLALRLPAAWARLTPRESLVLLFQCRDGLPQRTIAALLGIGAPRVSRLIDGAHARLRAALSSPSSLDCGCFDVPHDALRRVVEQFLATSFLDLRPGEGRAPGPPASPEPR
jgi:DNA-directed RNA polymerase specialized sigma24 family protein